MFIEVLPDSGDGKVSKSKKDLITFKAEKCRDGVIEPFSAKPVFGENSFQLVRHDGPPSKPQSKSTDAKQRMLDQLASSGEVTRKGLIENLPEFSHSTIDRALKELQEEGRICRANSDAGVGVEATYALRS